MFDRMSPEQLAKAKSSTGNTLRKLALHANGHGGVTRVEARKAEQELERAVGKRKAKQMRESALQAAGAPPKGLRRFFG